MEYIVIGLLAVIICVLWVKNPSKIQLIVTDKLLERIKNNRESIVEGAYKKLPAELKEDLPEAVIKSLLEEVIDSSVDVIKEGLE